MQHTCSALYSMQDCQPPTTTCVAHHVMASAYDSSGLRSSALASRSRRPNAKAAALPYVIADSIKDVKQAAPSSHCGWMIFLRRRVTVILPPNPQLSPAYRLQPREIAGLTTVWAGQRQAWEQCQTLDALCLPPLSSPGMWRLVNHT